MKNMHRRSKRCCWACAVDRTVDFHCWETRLLHYLRNIW